MRSFIPPRNNEYKLIPFVTNFQRLCYYFETDGGYRYMGRIRIFLIHTIGIFDPQQNAQIETPYDSYVL